MNDGDPAFCACERACERGIRIAVHEDGRRIFLDDDVFQGAEHLPCHRGMSAAVNTKIVFRVLDSELGKKHVRHVPVKVLSGVDQHLFDLSVVAQRARKREGLDELRPRTHHRNNPDGRSGLCRNFSVLRQRLFPVVLVRRFHHAARSA